MTVLSGGEWLQGGVLAEPFELVKAQEARWPAEGKPAHLGANLSDPDPGGAGRRCL